MRTTAQNYRGGIASLLAGTQALRQGIGDVVAGTYGFTDEARRKAELARMLDEATKKRAGMDIAAANAPPSPTLPADVSKMPFDLGPPTSGMPVKAPFDLSAAPLPAPPVAASGMPAPPPTGTFGGRPGTPTVSWKDTLAPVSVPGVSGMDRPAGPMFTAAQRAGVGAPPPMAPPTPRVLDAGMPGGPLAGMPPKVAPGPVGMPGLPGAPGAAGAPPLTPDDLAMMKETGLGSLLGMGGAPKVPPAPSPAEALTIARHDPFAAGPIPMRQPDPFGGEKKGLLLDRAISTLQGNPGQAAAMTDRLLGRGQEDTPDAVRADIETLGALDGSPESYRSAMPQMRSNLGRKELFSLITEGIKNKRAQDEEARKFGQQKTLKQMEEEGATGRTKMTVDAGERNTAARAAATLQGSLARIVAARTKAEGKPALTAKAYMDMERGLLKEAIVNARENYKALSDPRAPGFDEKAALGAKTAWDAAVLAESKWTMQEAMKRWQKDYSTAVNAPTPEAPATGGDALGKYGLTDPSDPVQVNAALDKAEAAGDEEGFKAIQAAHAATKE